MRAVPPQMQRSLQVSLEAHGRYMVDFIRSERASSGRDDGRGGPTGEQGLGPAGAADAAGAPVIGTAGAAAASDSCERFGAEQRPRAGGVGSREATWAGHLPPHGLAGEAGCSGARGASPSAHPLWPTAAGAGHGLGAPRALLDGVGHQLSRPHVAASDENAAGVHAEGALPSAGATGAICPAAPAAALAPLNTFSEHEVVWHDDLEHVFEDDLGRLFDFL